MIKFLLQRPIAVVMAFTACFIVGWVTYFTLPVSLLPNIAIPEITVQVTASNTSARELENTHVKPIRQQLMQVAGLRDIHSQTRDGAGLIRLSFDFGTSIDLAFIEVNEKIDAAMNYLPREAERPRVVKASATDIPVFCLNLTLRSEEEEVSGGYPHPASASTSVSERKNDPAAFLELCQFAETVIKRRIEQLPEVAMVDMTGQVGRQVRITPRTALMEMAGITLDDLESVLQANNIEAGSMTVRDGYYEYNIKFSTLLRTVEDVQEIYLRKNGRIFQLKELADIAVVAQRETGVSMAGGRRAVTLAVIKQADENMDRLKAALSEVTDSFADSYPDIRFSITRNQTELLDYTLSNLKQNLGLGFLFICLVSVLFLGDVKSPAVIGLSIVVSVVISFLFFYLFDRSLNIISMSGLILALGMMIDSAIIVTENIAQYRAKGHSLEEACAYGTTEVITPMLSSTLTTIAVFVPLIFMSGIAGAIFFDQAFAVTIGLLVSYFTAILLLPVLYKGVYSLPAGKGRWAAIRIHNPIKAHTLDRFYDAGVDLVFRRKKLFLGITFLTLPGCIGLFYLIPKNRMPEIDQNEQIVRIEWNEHIHLDENQARVRALWAALAPDFPGIGQSEAMLPSTLPTGVPSTLPTSLPQSFPQTVAQATEREGYEYTAYIGQQQFLLNRDQELSVSEAELYFKMPETSQIVPLQQAVARWLRQCYPAAVFTFSPPETVFEKLFVTGEADLVAEFYSHNKAEAPDAALLRQMEKELEKRTGHVPTGIAFDRQLNISVDREKLLLYHVDYGEVYRLLKTAFKENEIATLRSYQQYLPIVLGGNEQNVREILQNTLIRTTGGGTGADSLAYIPLQAVVRLTPGEDLKTITAGKNGEYIPFSFYGVEAPDRTMAEIRAWLGREPVSREWAARERGGRISTQEKTATAVLSGELSGRGPAGVKAAGKEGTKGKSRSEGQPSEVGSGQKRFTDRKSAGRVTAEKGLPEEVFAEARPTERRWADGRSANEESAKEKSVNGESVNEGLENRKSMNEESMNKRSANGELAGGRSPEQANPANPASPATRWDIDFSGSFFSNRQMLNELVVILFVSLLLMYFILAAQFESFLQPLIVLVEIPIDVAASLFVLWLCGHTLNLMSAIGIVVTCGIIINDSILKLDAINELRKEGIPLFEAIHEAGRRRLRPIIMTSLTTIFGMVPLLFSFDMGSELQKPLSIAMISAMLVGTAVSLFIIPLIYWYIYRKDEPNRSRMQTNLKTALYENR